MATPIGFLAYFHDGLGGFTVHSSRTERWQDMARTELLATRVIFAEKNRARTLHKSCIWRGEWTWVYFDARGQWHVDRSWDIDRPLVDALGNAIPDRMMKQGVEISDEDWAKLYPIKTHNDVDTEAARWQ